MFVSSNGSLLNSFAKLTKNKTSKNQLTEKLSSGKRINKAADDAGGLSISESLKAQVRGLNRAEKIYRMEFLWSKYQMGLWMK